MPHAPDGIQAPQVAPLLGGYLLKVRKMLCNSPTRGREWGPEIGKNGSLYSLDHECTANRALTLTQGQGSIMCDKNMPDGEG